MCDNGTVRVPSFNCQTMFVYANYGGEEGKLIVTSYIYITVLPARFHSMIRTAATKFMYYIHVIG